MNVLACTTSNCYYNYSRAQMNVCPTVVLQYEISYFMEVDVANSGSEIFFSLA